MRAVKTFFAFHRRPTWAELRAGASVWSVLGHVEAFGFTEDGTWFFYNPMARRTDLLICHRHDDVDLQLWRVYSDAAEVFVTDHRAEFRFPVVAPLNCVSRCAHLIGIRAFTPWGFRKRLLAIGAQKMEAPDGTEGRPG